MVQCLIWLLDGTNYEVDINKKCTGKELLDMVCERLNLVEGDFFGLTYLQSNVKFWIYNTKPVSKQLKKGPWNVAFELKFYPDPMLLREEFTRYHVYLQLRRDISDGKLPCSFVAEALLGSYAAQSELGDYVPQSHADRSVYLKIVEYSKSSMLHDDELLDRIAELHRTHRGQTQSQAEFCYLDNAKNLALYGVHVHEAKDSEGHDVDVGVCAAGLLVHREGLRIHRYTWPKILKIRYKRNLFHVDIRPEDKEQKAPVDSYKLSNAKMAKRLWRIAVEHHAFFRLRESVPEGRGMFSRAPYRYTGRTLYETRRDAALMGQHNPEFNRATTASYVTGSRSVDDLTLGYSTERWEKHVSDDPRTVTLDLRQRRGTGSMGDLDRVQYDPNLEGQLSLLAGEGRATYRPVNGDISYNTAGSSQAAAGQFSGQFAGQAGRTSYTPQEYDGYDDRYGAWPAGGTGSGNVSSDVPVAAQSTRRKRIASRDSQRLSSQSSGGGYDYGHPDYTGTADVDAAGEWSPHPRPSSPVTTTSTRTYTAPDGSVVTEYRTERNGVIETHIEKRTRVSSVEEEDVDYDKELADAIFAVTEMDPNMSVQKIEIHTTTEV